MKKWALQPFETSVTICSSTWCNVP